MTPKKVKLNISKNYIKGTFDKLNINIRTVSNTILNIRISNNNEYGSSASYSIEKKLSNKNLQLVNEDNYYYVQFGSNYLKINKNKFSFSLLDKNKNEICKGKPFNLKNGRFTDRKLCRKEDEIFALGEKITPLGRRGYQFDNWNTDNPRHHNETDKSMYVSIPFYISINKKDKSVYGYFLDTPYRTFFDIGHDKWDEIRTETAQGDFDLYLLCGDNISEIVKSYTTMTGTHPMPPVWALGYHQCRYSYMSTKEAFDIACNFRKRKIPCDVIWYDINYMDNFRVFTFGPEHFGDIKKHLSLTRKKGFRSVFIVDPGVKVDKKGIYDVCDDGTDKNYFLKNPDNSDYIGKVWPGGTKYPDFTNPEVRKWWGALHKRYYDVGADAFWNDMNEPSDFSNDEWTVPLVVKAYDNNNWSGMDKIHNVYGLLEAKATFEGMLKLKPAERPFILTRAGFSGLQKYSAKWCGDNTSTWAHLKNSIPQLLNLGLSGVGFCGVDVGGFSGNITPELLARWTQLGAFYPFFRNHTTEYTVFQEPWRFGKEIENICRKAIELRYHLIPYYYQLFHEMYKHGYPVLRPIFWAYPGDQKAYECLDQFMIGSFLLAAPIVERNSTSRKVYLPEGIWYDFENGKCFKGRGEYIISAPLTKQPLFVKAGAVLPVMSPVDSTEYLDKTLLDLKIIPGNNSVCEKFYEDDMLSNEYKKGKFIYHKIKLNSHDLKIRLDLYKSKIKKIRIKILSGTVANKPDGFIKNGIWFEKQFPAKEKIYIEF